MYDEEDKIIIPEKVMKYNILKSPYYALVGIYTAFKREPNLSLQLFVGISFTIFGIFHQRWVTAVANLILMSIVISLEMLNSAIETLCDLVQPDYHPKVKIIKDIAAGAVLMVALSWLVVILYQISIVFIFKNLSF